MASNEVVLILKSLKEQWAILKDEEAPRIKRREAAKKIIDLQKEAVKIDDTFEVSDLTLTKYAELLPDIYKPKSKVDWVSTDFEISDLGYEYSMSWDTLDVLEGMAVKRTRARLPREPEDSQKFGMIVSSYTDKLINLFVYYQNLPKN